METLMKSSKKFWKPPSFEDFNVSIPSKKIKLDSDDFPEEKPPEIHFEPKEPKAVGELAIHPKKIQEVRNWMKGSCKEKAPVLLITGPAGSGKTTTLRVSASEEGILIKEWINPIDKTEFKAESVFQNEIYDKFSFSESRQTDKFDDFIFHSSRYKSLFETEESTLILVEDIPNIFVWRPKQFHSFLEKYKSHGRCPIVFILTDDQALNLSNSLFPTHIRIKYNIKNIKFNPVNHSALIKNLKSLSDCYCPEKVSSEVLESVIKNSGGDVRSAANDLLLLLRTNGPHSKQLGKKAKKGKQSEGPELSPKALPSKDLSQDFYHVVGRILYPKLRASNEGPESRNPSQMLVHDVQQLAGSWNSSFLGVLHENYLQTFTKLKDVVEGAACFSLCGLLDRGQELEGYVGLIGVSSLMLSNTEPKKTGFNPLKRSFHLEGSGGEEEAEVGEGFQGHQVSRRDFLLDLAPYLKILKESSEDYQFVGRPLENGNDEECDEELMEIEEFDD